MVTVSLSGGTIPVPLSASTSVQWTVNPSLLKALIAGGNRYVSLVNDSSVLLLDASYSFDPDVAGNAARNNLFYMWNCTQQNSGLPCDFFDDYAMSLTNSTLSISSEQLGLRQSTTATRNDALIFTLTISKDVRSSISSVSITTTRENVPNVQIRSVDVVSNAALTPTGVVRIPLNERLTLRGSVDVLDSNLDPAVDLHQQQLQYE